MMNLSERIDMTVGKPTRHQTETNRYPLNCGICRDLFYVDEQILRRTYSALRSDQSEVPFSCDSCEEQYAEASYAR